MKFQTICDTVRGRRVTNGIFRPTKKQERGIKTDEF